MFRCCLLALAVFACAPPVRPDDSLPPGTVATVKKATVYIQTDGDGWGSTGSGFVVGGDDRALLIATNNHVIAAPAAVRDGKKPTLRVVFESGTKTERSFPARVVAADPERDLAILRVTGVKDPPRPIPITGAAKASETMPVYTFGFPLGEDLSFDKKNPAITVGKASVSSLRNGPDGELARIQIDGNLNPGNSGGPVVDAKGHLVGVAVSIIRDTHGIGLIVPADELGKMMRGRVGAMRVTVRQANEGTSARFEATLLDPLGKLTGATVRYLILEPGDKRPDLASLAGHAGSMAAPLKLADGIGTAEIAVPKAGGEILVQVTTDPPQSPTRPQAFPLVRPLQPADLTGPPRAGWKEYVPRDRSFVMWVPEKPLRQSEQDRTSIARAQRLHTSGVVGLTSSGLAYEGRTVSLPVSFIRVPRKDQYDLFFDAMADELDGRVIATKAVTTGTLAGIEATIEAGKVSSRMRVYLRGPRVHIVQVIGPTEKIGGAEAELLLTAYRLPAGGVVAAPPPGFPAPMPVVPKPSISKVVAHLPGKTPAVVGGTDPYFKDAAPKDGVLVGVEVVLGDEGVKAVMPLYRVGKVDHFGTQFGTATDAPVTLKARPGYAVGGITAKARAACDGFSLTFMKVVDGQLDPSDSYESEWVGGNGPAPAQKHVSDGVPVVGFVGRANAKDVTGVGLLFQGQDAFPPKK